MSLCRQNELGRVTVLTATIEFGILSQVGSHGN
jgi:hypothetical protein